MKISYKIQIFKIYKYNIYFELYSINLNHTQELNVIEIIIINFWIIPSKNKKFKIQGYFL